MVFLLSKKEQRPNPRASRAGASEKSEGTASTSLAAIDYFFRVFAVCLCYHNTMKARDVALTALLVIIFLVPPFFAIDWGYGTTVVIVSAALALYIYFLPLSDQRARMQKYAQRILILFFVWAFLQTLLFSHFHYSSFMDFLMMICAALILFIGIPKALTERAAYILIIGACALVIVGLVMFMRSDMARLMSTLYDHNVLAGFLIAPLILSLWFFCKEKESGYLYAALVAVIIIAGFTLTFSRGGFIGAAAALAIFLWALWRDSASTKKFFQRTAFMCALIVIGIALAYGIWTLRLQHRAQQGVTIASSPYQSEREGETAFDARIRYLTSALELFRSRPLVGFGLDSYGSEYARIQKDVRFLAMDPHNIYARYFVELGIVGGALFLLFLWYLLWRGWRTVAYEKNNFLAGAFFAGFVGIVVNNAGEAMFQYFPGVIIFFAIAALFLGSIDDTRAYITSRTRYLISAIGIFVISSLVLLSAILFEKGGGDDIMQTAVDPHNAFITWALRLDLVNPYIRMQLAGYYIQSHRYDEASAMLDRVRLFSPNSRNQFLLLGWMYREKGDFARAASAYESAIQLAPYRDLEPEKNLVAIYRAGGQTEKIRPLIEAALARYPLEAFDSPQWINPFKPQLLSDRQYLELILAELNKKQGD